MVGTNAHHPASLPSLSECHFPNNVEFFNRIAEQRTVGCIGLYDRRESLIAIPLGGDKRDQALVIGQSLQLYWCLANIDHHPVDL